MCLGPLSAIPLGEGRTFEVAGATVAVFRARSGEVFATQASCPHRGGPLADGMVGGGLVACPLHAFKFELSTGRAVGHDCGSLRTYPVEVTETGELILHPTPVRPEPDGLAGQRVVLLEGRMRQELAELIRRHGGEPICVPAVREQPRSAGPEVAAMLDRVRGEADPVFVLLTGVAVSALFREVEAFGRKQELLETLSRSTILCRGPKPVGALGKEGIRASIQVSAPWTTGEVLSAIGTLELRDRHAVLLHYGERNVPIVEALSLGGARVDEVLLYEWKLPDDVSGLMALVDEVIAGQVGAVLFTSQVQARHLFDIAARQGRSDALRQALSERTVVAAVGPTCASALETFGVKPAVVPEHPKMGAAVLRLAQYLGGRANRAAR